MRNNILLLEDGLKLFYRSKKKQFFKTKKYEGKSTKICKEIIQDCYNKQKNYFMVSPNNFNQFYARDFGMICESLLKLGYKKEVINTITYAMTIYEKIGQCTTQINTRGKPLDFPSTTPESISYMLNSIILTKNKKLIEKYKPFFKEQAKKIYEEDIDKETGLLRKDKEFSSMKDYSKQQSACYTNCMLALFTENIKKIGIICDLHTYEYDKLIKKYFWREEYFIDDLSGKEQITGDANIFPFWTGIIKDEDMFYFMINTIKTKKLDEPFALKYNREEDKIDFHPLNVLNKNYEHGTIWMHLAMCYLKILDMHGEKTELKRQLKKQKELIEKQKTFIEVYTKDGKPFRSLVFEHDEAMIWSAKYLELARKYKIK